MDIVITGGTGFLGREFIKSRKNDSITVITRGNGKNEDDISYVSWSQLERLKRADVVINFAGFPLASKKWNPDIKKEIYESRISTTSKVVEFMKGLKEPPKLFMSGSAVGYYGTSLTEKFTENSSPGSGYLAGVCVDWEKEALAAKSITRTVLIRTSSVISLNGGFMPNIIQKKIHSIPYFGNGMQWISWIYITDFIAAMNFIIESDLEGAVNMCTPEAIRFKEFSRKAAESLGYFSVKVPERIGELILGREMFHEVMGGQNVLPEKLLDKKFIFKFPKIDDALEDMKK
ncbi:MAG: TIGR01777 family oxidoreductase [Thermoplasmata archaeon]